MSFELDGYLSSLKFAEWVKLNQKSRLKTLEWGVERIGNDSSSRSPFVEEKLERREKG